MTKNVTFLYQTLTYLVHSSRILKSSLVEVGLLVPFLPCLRANQPSLNHDGGHKMAISLHIFFSSGRNNGVTTKRTRSSHFFMLLSLYIYIMKLLSFL